MIQVQVKIDVTEQKRAEVLALLLHLEHHSRQEAGCITYLVYERSHETGSLFIYEIWESEEHLKAHEQTTHFLETTGKLPQLTENIELVKRSLSGMLNDTIHSRRSIRNYTPERLTESQLDRLLRAAMQAPSAHNFQPWEFIVVDDESQKRAISQMSPYAKPAERAAALILVCANLERTGKDSAWWPQDLSAATQNILLQATDDQLGAVWLGFWPDKERVGAVKALFQLPEQIVPFSVIAVGVPEKPSKVEDRFDANKIHRNGF